MEQDLKALELSLTKEHIEALESVVPFELGFPYYAIVNTLFSSGISMNTIPGLWGQGVPAAGFGPVSRTSSQFLGLIALLRRRDRFLPPRRLVCTNITPRIIPSSKRDLRSPLKITNSRY